MNQLYPSFPDHGALVRDHDLSPGHTKAAAPAAPAAVNKYESFTGNHYDIRFPFSDHQHVVSLPAQAFELALVYASLLFLLAAVMVIVPAIVLVQMNHPQNMMHPARQLVLFIPRVLHKLGGICLGFITVTALMLLNVLRCLRATAREIAA